MFTIYADGQLIYTPGDQDLLVLQPKLTLEMGAAGSLDFSVPPGHPYYDQFKQLSTVVYAKYDDSEIFRGRVLSSSRDFYNFRQTYCEGALSYLVDSVQKGEKYQGTAHGLFRQIIANHNSLVDEPKRFTVGNITVPDKDVKIAGRSTGSEEDPDAYAADYWRQIYIDSVADNWSTTLDYLNTCLIDYLGGYLMVRRVGSTNYIDWVQEYATTATQEIEFGTNLLDMTEEISADDLFTVLIPIGDENLTIASVNGGSIEIADSTLVSKYGRIVRTEVFGNVNQASTLLENGQNYLAKESSAPITFTIKAVDLSMIDDSVTAIKLGDRVKIKSIPHNIDQYYTCTKIEYDLEKPENTVFTFGNPHQSLTQRYRRDKRVEQERQGYQGYSGYGGLGNRIANPETGDTKKKLDNFFKEWIDIDPDNPDGIGSLGGMYTQYKKDKKVLENTVGIDFDAQKGTIDIYADHEQWERDRQTLKNNVGINLDSPAGTISIFADHTQWEKDRQTLYNNLGVNLDSPAGTIDIYSTTTNFNNRINAEETATAQIKLWAGTDQYGNIGSNIALNADLVSVSNRLSAIEGIFSNITTETAYASRGISAGNFYSRHFYVNTGDDTTEYDLARHAHNIVANSSGGLYLTGPIPISSRVPFNIADTSYYQTGVSAVVLNGLSDTYYAYDDEILSDVVSDSSRTLYSGGTLFGCFITTLSNGNRKTIRVGLNGEKAYQAGVSAKSVSSIRYGTYSDDGSTDYGHIYITFSDGSTSYLALPSNGYTAGWNAGYTRGQDSVSQRSVSSVGYETYDSGDTDYGHIWVRYSDGNYQGNIYIQNAYNLGKNSVNTQTYYNNGYNAGYSDGESYGFHKGGYRMVYLGSSYGNGAYATGYYYPSSRSSQMTSIQGASPFNAEYAILYFN